MELYEKMGHELHELIVKKEVSAREVTDSFLSRIDAVEDKVKSFLTLLPDSARAQADEVDALVARGEQLPPLAGLPIATGNCMTKNPSFGQKDGFFMI